MTRIPSSSTIKFHSRLWKRREGKYSFQYWPFRESGWNKKTVSWIFLQKNLITVYRINQSLENAIVTAPFYVLHARDTREEGGREGGGVRDRSFEKTRENGRGEKRGEVRTTTTFQRRSISIEPSRENGGKICSRGEEKGGKGGEKGGERSGEERKRSVAERMIKRGRKKEDEWQSGMESGKCALASFLFFFFSSFFFSFFSFFPLPPVDKADLPVSWPPSRIFSVSLSHDSLMHELLWTIARKERWRGEGVEKHVVRFMIDLSVDDKLLNWSTIKLYLLFTYCIWQCVCGSIVYLKKGKDNI